MKKLPFLLPLQLFIVVSMPLLLNSMPAPETSQESKWLQNNATYEQKEMIAKLVKADKIANDKGYSVSLIRYDSPEHKMFDGFLPGIQTYIMSKLPHTFFENTQKSFPTDYTLRDEIKDIKVNLDDINNFIYALYTNKKS